MVIIIIAVSALLLIALILGARYLYNKMRIEKAKAEEIKNTQKNLHKKGQIRVIPRGKGYESTLQKNGPGAEEENEAEELDKVDELGEIYEEQYDPNQEFRIFGIGD